MTRAGEPFRGLRATADACENSCVMPLADAHTGAHVTSIDDHKDAVKHCWRPLVCFPSAVKSVFTLLLELDGLAGHDCGEL